MTVSPPPAQTLARGRAALSGGRWEEAVTDLTDALGSADHDTEAYADAATGLSDALWWLGRVDEALDARERAYRACRRIGDQAGAVGAAVWLAREYSGAVGNDAASAGWLARAETLAADSPGSPGGWVELTRAVLATDPAVQEPAARAALAEARTSGEGDLEVLALGRLGLALVSVGRIDDGLARFDEAMAAATGGEADRRTTAQLCCDLVLATELSGEVERFAKWNDVIQRSAADSGHPQLVAFCAVCCAEVFSAQGEWSVAERELRSALDVLRRTGHRARCVPPAAKLAELLLAQGRIEEADQLIGEDDSDASLLVRARLALARDDAALAVTLLDRHCRRHGGDSLLTAPAIAVLVDAHLAANDVSAADGAARRLAELADLTGNRRTAGRAALARARVLTAGDQAEQAVATLEEALDVLTASAPGALETAEAHLDLARLRVVAAPTVARAEARAALAGFEAAGAPRLADSAASLLRELGDRSRVGAKGTGVLTVREREVLQLVAQGLTNAEIAERLFISVKTAGNHVSNILTKLGVRSRVEATAYAALHAAD